MAAMLGIDSRTAQNVTARRIPNFLHFLIRTTMLRNHLSRKPKDLYQASQFDFMFPQTSSIGQIPQIPQIP
eukprot:10237585-Karenia_brevis.AAC.1